MDDFIKLIKGGSVIKIIKIIELFLSFPNI